MSSVRSRVFTSAVFFCHAALFAAWTPHIPGIKSALRLGDAALGVALLGAPAGSVVAMFVAGAAVSRFGSAATVRLTLVGYVLSPLALGAGAGATPEGLFAVLVVWGAFQGSLDVAMNSHAAGVERAYGRPIFTSFHAYWSLGGVAGAALGATAVAAGVGMPAQFLVMGTLVAAVLLPASRWAAATDVEDEDGMTRSRRIARPTRPLLVLGTLAFCALLCEGSVADWSAVLMRDSLGAAAGVAGLGYACYSVGMLASRAGGDRLVRWGGPTWAIRCGTAVSGVALLVGLAVGVPVVALAALAVFGLGLGVVTPSILGASSRIPGQPGGPALAAVTAFGWAGFVCGPPLIGMLSGFVGLRAAMGVVVLLCGVVCVAAGSARIQPVAGREASSGPARPTPAGGPRRR
jgi:hypothetical protein